MAEIRAYVEVLREMCEDVKTRVAEAKKREETWSKAIAEVSSEYAASKIELANIKKTFSFANWFKTRKKNGITAEQAREEAQRYSTYAETVDQIADEEKRMEDAKMSFSKAVDDVTKREMAQERIEELMGILGMIEQSIKVSSKIEPKVGSIFAFTFFPKYTCKKHNNQL